MSFFRQEDEMDKFIALKSLKISYWFTVLFLLIWCITLQKVIDIVWLCCYFVFKIHYLFSSTDTIDEN